MKLNTDKCHLLVSGHKHEEMWIRIGQDKIWEDKTVKLLGVTIDNSLKFDQHVSDICSKANRKLKKNYVVPFLLHLIVYNVCILTEFK